MQVIGTFSGYSENVLAQQVTVVERENEFRLKLTDAFDPERVVNIFRGMYWNTVASTQLGYGSKEAVFVGSSAWVNTAAISYWSAISASIPAHPIS